MNVTDDEKLAFMLSMLSKVNSEMTQHNASKGQEELSKYIRASKVKR